MLTATQMCKFIHRNTTDLECYDNGRDEDGTQAIQVFMHSEDGSFEADLFYKEGEWELLSTGGELIADGEHFSVEDAQAVEQSMVDWFL